MFGARTPVLSKTSCKSRLQGLSQRVLRELGVTGSCIEIDLLGDAQMRLLERRYMKKEKKIVDVLSFPAPSDFPHPESSKKNLGEVFLNWDLLSGDRARMEFLLIHGILHILGYRHDRKRDIMIMENLEQRLCQRILSRDLMSEPRVSKR